MNSYILIGFMGSGKSTLGKLLAEKLMLDFLDTDDMIEKNEKMSINEIFESKGEEAFRAFEADLVQNLSVRRDYVLSVGGGLPAIEGMMQKLNEMGTTIYLKVSNEELVRRLTFDAEHRPLIKGMDQKQLEALVKERLAVREQYYEKAKLVVNGDQLTLETLYNSLSKQ
jgi:shikimate kinase